MTWVFLPIVKRWVNIDHIASVNVAKNKDGAYDVTDKTGALHETCQEDAEVIIERISKIANDAT